jgi:hypothetical protein
MIPILERRVAAGRSVPRHRWLVPVLALVAGAWGCREHITAPEQRPTGDLHFLRTRAGAPPLASLSASFYAKRGESRGVTLYYHALAGETDSAKFLDFRVPAGALATSPDGRTYLPGDSVLIRVTITDPAHMVVQFEPSGLKFSPESPARLGLSFLEADNDLDQDGVVNGNDDQLRGQLAIWVQETPGGLWTKMSSALFLDLEELEVNVAGFSGYAAAY